MALRARAAQVWLHDEFLFSEPAIVLVHGAWADGSCWKGVVLPLECQGFEVICAPIPSDDSAANVPSRWRVLWDGAHSTNILSNRRNFWPANVSNGLRSSKSSERTPMGPRRLAPSAAGVDGKGSGKLDKRRRHRDHHLLRTIPCRTNGIGLRL